MAGCISHPDHDVFHTWPPADRRRKGNLVERKQLRLGAIAAADRCPGINLGRDGRLIGRDRLQVLRWKRWATNVKNATSHTLAIPANHILNALSASGANVDLYHNTANAPTLKDIVDNAEFVNHIAKKPSSGAGTSSRGFSFER